MASQCMIAKFNREPKFKVDAEIGADPAAAHAGTIESSNSAAYAFEGWRSPERFQA